MTQKKKLKPNSEIINQNLFESSITAVNNAYREYSLVLIDYYKYSGYDSNGVFYEYAGLKDKLEEAKQNYYRLLERHFMIKKAIEEDDEATMIAIHEGRI